jgi:hypothetical protein
MFVVATPTCQERNVVDRELYLAILLVVTMSVCCEWSAVHPQSYMVLGL